jgi:hypothetical protein
MCEQWTLTDFDFLRVGRNPLIKFIFAHSTIPRKALFLLTKTGSPRPPARKSLILLDKSGLL